MWLSTSILKPRNHTPLSYIGRYSTEEIAVIITDSIRAANDLFVFNPDTNNIPSAVEEDLELRVLQKQQQHE